MKKRQFCKEKKRIVYTVNKHGEQASYCKLDCVVKLVPECDDLPWELTQKLEAKYPNLTHKFFNTFSIHIEAKATCHSGDVFDEKKGKTIAYSKAQLKLYTLLSKIYTDIENYFTEQQSTARNIKEMFLRYKAREENFISSI